MKHISILVTNKALIAAIGNTRYMFSSVNDFLKEAGIPPLFDVQLVGLSKEVELDNGIYTIQLDTTIYELGKTDLILIPPVSGDVCESIALNKDFIPWIKQQYQNGAQVASLCVGAFLLAETGLLDDRWCSTHWKSINEFRETYPKVRLVNQVITDDRGLYTSGGANSYWNLLIYLVGKFSNHEIAIRTSKYFEVDMDRESQSPYAAFEGSRFHNDDAIHKVQEYVERHYQDQLNLEMLADIANLGHRTFQRRFKNATHHTVIVYIQKIRVEAAKKFLEQETLTVSEIMYEVGYTDPEAFRKIFKRETDLSPMQYRTKYQERKVTPLPA
ncbi:transcriptional regulator GlxA family with amidase domain [Algoriphagus sp. 4150]|uniref:GlxA family transcriptional regulator n=1 Tax=Algoriphagus sp. 4150 TaxID=2817756 RepID=UPI002857DF8C|nr:helix-turn-helix domain-containing protein [Algoriphagus sp. 4150]MDR7130595.1 transcriptional regulator GlxA family with amidase domain [Algoriphagus sp. 4150]